jgi:plastocyanin
MRKPIWIVALVVLIAAGAACSDDGGDTADDTTTTVEEPAEDDTSEEAGDDVEEGGALTVTARDFSFDPNQVEVEAGGEVTLTFANDGEVPHTFTSDALGVDERAAPGQTVDISFDAPDGEAEFHCEIHPGMIGSVTTG